MPEERELNVEEMTLQAFDRSQAAIVVDSKILGEKILIASDGWRRGANEPPCPYTIYRVSEIVRLLNDQGLDPEGLKLIHAAKSTFDATITRMNQGEE